MKPLLYSLLVFATAFVFTSCARKKPSAIKNTIEAANQKQKTSFKKLDKLFITVDFNGDGRKDTVYQHNYSRLTKSEITSYPDPFNNEYDTVVNFFNKHQSDVYLTLSDRLADTLHLGFAIGLYCLINLGDINKDGKDEIALVVDYCDWSRLNSCKIFSICSNKWVELKEFGINEDAFDFTGDSIPVFKEIPGYLELKNGIWKYLDYNKYLTSTTNEVGQMKRLKLKGCN